jgi:hypothetical protein
MYQRALSRPAAKAAKKDKPVRLVVALLVLECFVTILQDSQAIYREGSVEALLHVASLQIAQLSAIVRQGSFVL